VYVGGERGPLQGGGGANVPKDNRTVRSEEKKKKTLPSPKEGGEKGPNSSLRRTEATKEKPLGRILKEKGKVVCAETTPPVNGQGRCSFGGKKKKPKGQKIPGKHQRHPALVTTEKKVI